MPTFASLTHGLALGVGALTGAIAMGRLVAATDRLTNPIDPVRGIRERGLQGINGAQLMVHLRGEDRANPPLLYIHGGPGGSVDGIGHLFQRPWEEHFTVAHFDQRGAGASPPPPGGGEPIGMTFAQHLEDTVAVAEHVLRRTGHDKLFVIGHSWGSCLGAAFAQRRPDLVHAYIGIGQVVSWQENFEESRRLLIEEAERTGAAKIAKALREVETPMPTDAKARMKYVAAIQLKLMPLGKGFRAVRAKPDYLGFLLTAALTNPNRGVRDRLRGLVRALTSLGPHRPASKKQRLATLLDDIHEWDLRDIAGTDYEVPVFFFMGDHDFQTPVTLAQKYFDEISAPRKEWVAFADSAHFVVVEEPGKVLLELVDRVRPVATEESPQAATAGRR